MSLEVILIAITYKTYILLSLSCILFLDIYVKYRGLKIHFSDTYKRPRHNKIVVSIRLQQLNISLTLGILGEFHWHKYHIWSLIGDLINHPCHICNCGLVNLVHGWIITFYCFTSVYLPVHDRIRRWFSQSLLVQYLHKMHCMCGNNLQCGSIYTNLLKVKRKPWKCNFKCGNNHKWNNFQIQPSNQYSWSLALNDNL